jgi:hypothetical protein
MSHLVSKLRRWFGQVPWWSLFESLEKTHKTHVILSFPSTCAFPAPHLFSLHILMVQIMVLRSTVHKAFWTPPTVLPLTGGGGSRIGNNNCADLDGPEISAQIYDPDWIPDPPIRYAFNRGGGGGLE